MMDNDPPEEDDEDLVEEEEVEEVEEVVLARPMNWPSAVSNVAFFLAVASMWYSCFHGR